MTNEEIVRDYLQARNKVNQIRVLADMNLTTMTEIKRILIANGVEDVAAPKPRGRRKKPAAAQLQEAETPPSAAPEPPQDDWPEVYREIENTLAALPEDMGVKARWAAGKMAAEMFAAYLMVRLRLGEEDCTDGQKDSGRDLRREDDLV